MKTTIFKYFFTKRKFFIESNSIEFSCRISKNKFFEFNIYLWKTWRDWFRVSFQWPMKEDHAGPWFQFSVFAFELEIKAYDHRHWDGFLKTWEKCTPDKCSLIEEENDEPPIGIG